MDQLFVAFWCLTLSLLLLNKSDSTFIRHRCQTFLEPILVPSRTILIHSYSTSRKEKLLKDTLLLAMDGLKITVFMNSPWERRARPSEHVIASCMSKMKRMATGRLDIITLVKCQRRLSRSNKLIRTRFAISSTWYVIIHRMFHTIDQRLCDSSTDIIFGRLLLRHSGTMLLQLSIPK
jgi:hypothetical protein